MKYLTSLFITFVLLSTLLSSTSCQHSNSPQSSASSKKPKNIILMIGDGMGPQQISLLHAFSKYSKLDIVPPEQFAFGQMAKQGVIGISATDAHDSLTTDSACSATHLSTGFPSLPGQIGIDHNGKEHQTILMKAQKRGLATGLVSNTRITHATPAAFASHSLSRRHEATIAENMLRVAPDVLLGGGARTFLPQGSSKKLNSQFTSSSRRKDNKNLLAVAQQKNYSVIHSKSELEKYSSGDESQQKKLLGLFTPSGMPEAIWQSQNNNNPDREIPNLLEMSQVAVNKLSKNKDGFFLMIEGGQIDWAGHRNDAGSLLHEMISFNKTLLWVFKWVKKNPDTLLIVTADHETGGFGFSYHIKDLEKYSKAISKDRGFKSPVNFGTHDTLDKLYKQKMGFSKLWGSFKKIKKSSQTPEKFQNMFNQISEFKISTNQAKDILASHTNPNFKEDHFTLRKKTIPKINDFASYYFKEKDARPALMGRAISDQQNVVWASGAHTATPVFVFAYGPQMHKFKDYHHHTDIGQLMQKSLGLE